MKSGWARTERLPWYFCGNFPKSHLPLKLYSRLMLVLLVTCGSQIFSAHQPLNICDGVSVWWKKNKGKKKKGDSTSNSTEDMSKLCMLLQPMSVRKIGSLHPSPLKTSNYTSGCTGLCERHECSREVECWLGSAIAKVFPTAGHLGEEQWTVCKGCLEI